MQNCIINEKSSIYRFCTLLEDSKIDYVWLHGYNNEKLGDVDLAVDAKSLIKIGSIVQKYAVQHGFRVLQVLQHEYCAQYFILGKLTNNQIEYLIPDICSDYVRNGRILIKAEMLLESRVFGDDFYKSDPLVEAEYIFLKRALKEFWCESHLDDFRNIFLAKKNELLHVLKTYLNNNLLKQFESVIEENNLDNLNNISTHLKKSILLKTLLQDPSGYFYYKFNNLIRIIKRIIKPTGLVIVVIGTDGSGKSTVINKLNSTLAPAFRRVKNYHWKPNILWENNSKNIVVTEPHKYPPRIFILSLVKLFFYIWQYLFGYLLRIYPKKIKSTLVIFDRYYYDMVIDQKRFRMKLPKSFIEFFIPVIPKPDLVFFLKTEASVALKRKNELNIEELKRQNSAFEQIVKENPNGFYAINNDEAIEDSIIEISQKVFLYLENRLK